MSHLPVLGLAQGSCKLAMCANSRLGYDFDSTGKKNVHAMRILVTGSAGHLGEALIRTLRGTGHEAIGFDILNSPFTSVIGSIVDRSQVKRCMQGIDAVLHTATLHKPHVITHNRQDFVDTNVTGTLNLLEEAAA